MKRYFDIEKDNITLELGFNKGYEQCSVLEIEDSLGFGGLREVGKQEFDRLTRVYTGEEEDLDGQTSLLD